MLQSWEGNCRSGIALASPHRLRDISTYGFLGLRERDEYLI